MKILITILICFISLYNFAKDYKVVHIKGDFFSEIKKRNLKVGDIVTDTENVALKNDPSNCILYSGTEKLSFKGNTNKSEGQISELFSPLPSRQLIGSRSENDSIYLKLSDYFVNKNYLFLGQDENITLDKTYISDLGNHKFIIVDSDKQKSIIQFNEATLTFTTASIFKEKETEKMLTIYKVNTQTGEFIKEISLNVVRGNPISLKEEISTILSMIPENKPKKEQKDLVFQLLVDIYGGLNSNLFDQFMATHFELY